MKNIFIVLAAAANADVMDKILYAGADGDAAIAALNRAGDAGEIVRGEIYRNPAPWRKRDFYHRTPAGKAAAARQARAAADVAQAQRREALTAARERARSAVAAAQQAAAAAGESLDAKEFFPMEGNGAAPGGGEQDAPPPGADSSADDAPPAATNADAPAPTKKKIRS
ncbi:MAG: hypothetical protein LBK76_03485 [Verrucomicrobiales bacterium]|jgi:hypothetical protein|nr:hypothetical protein [Verrucomicrobiales bacterium]